MVFFSGRIFHLIQCLLSFCKIKIILNGHSSRSFCINASFVQDLGELTNTIT